MTFLKAFVFICLILACTDTGPGNGHVTTFSVAILIFLSLYTLSINLSRLSGRLVLGCYGARPVAIGSYPELSGMLNQLALRAGLASPRLFIIESEVPNALAVYRTGHAGAVAVTRGLIRILEPRELAGVLAHEMAHLKQDKAPALIPTANAVNGCALLLVDLLRTLMLLSAGRAGRSNKRITHALAARVAALEQRVNAGSGEFAADAAGARLCGDPLWLADALRKVRAAEPPLIPGTTAHPGTHPLLGERIRRLEAMAYGAYL